MATEKEVVGLEQTLQVLKKVHRIVYDEMNKEIKVVLGEIRDDARGFAPSSTPSGLSNWAKQAPGTVWERLIFDPAAIKKGIVFKIGKTKINQQGFSSLFTIINKNAAGMIYEVAGTRNPNGRPPAGNYKRTQTKKYSKSYNEDAGRHFIDAITAQSVAVRGKQGRLVIRAGEKNQKRARAAILVSITKATRIAHEKMPKAVA
jgi:hypothetical protein